MRPGGKGDASGEPILGIPSLRNHPHDGIVQKRVYSGHGGVKRVVEAERIEESRLAMSLWRGRGGKSTRAREGGGGKQPLLECQVIGAEHTWLLPGN